MSRSTRSIGLVFAVVVAAALAGTVEGYVHGSVVQDAPAVVLARARAILGTAAAPLTSADVSLVQRAVRHALAGKYLVAMVEGAAAGRDGNRREDEYLFDERSRVRFHRFSEPDEARPGKRAWTILEFTDLPAVKCQDRTAITDRRLGMTFFEDWKGWHLGNPMVVDAAGSPWASESPGFALLNMPPDRFQDAGTQTVDGQRARGVRRSIEIGDVTLWIDVQTLLPLMERTAMAMGGKRTEVSSRYRYPAPRTITRPIALPDCI